MDKLALADSRSARISRPNLPMALGEWNRYEKELAKITQASGLPSGWASPGTTPRGTQGPDKLAEILQQVSGRTSSRDL